AGRPLAAGGHDDRRTAREQHGRADRDRAGAAVGAGLRQVTAAAVRRGRRLGRLGGGRLGRLGGRRRRGLVRGAGRGRGGLLGGLRRLRLGRRRRLLLLRRLGRAVPGAAVPGRDQLLLDDRPVRPLGQRAVLEA